ncbi:TPA: alpha/beta hydrolase, partial [Klebsiella pneumoniae]|nr:alpha/beta hydrolase [Klebsiella pneumoniae]HDY7331855.1 alpha/beta hydrolase [Klebsiella pneumoniae]
MNKHVAAMLTMLIIPSAFAQTPLTDSKTIVIKPSALAVEMVPDIAYSFTQNIMGRPLQLTMDLLKPYADKPLPAVVFITGGGFLDAPKSKFIGQRVDIARAGYVVASITYRV